MPLVGPHMTEYAQPVAEKSWAVVTWQSGRQRGGCLSALAFLALQVHLACSRKKNGSTALKELTKCGECFLLKSISVIIPPSPGAEENAA